MNRQTFVTSLHSKSIDIAHISRVNVNAISEDDILYLNDLLLTNGLHEVVVKNIGLGCTIIETFLMCLNKYQWVYWLSLPGKKSPPIYDLKDDLKAYGCLGSVSMPLYEAYFSEQFYADCLIIESTKELLQQQWYYYFYKAMCKACLAKRMPIIQLITHRDT